MQLLITIGIPAFHIFLSLFSDHAGGNVELIETFPSAVVYGFDTRIPALTKALRDGESFTLGKLRVQAIHNPCHTTGSLSYVIHDDNMEATEQAVFTGDTLFMAGCGRFFEGTAADMYEALYKRLGRLSPSTKVFVGHEYTIKNLEVQPLHFIFMALVCYLRRT